MNPQVQQILSALRDPKLNLNWIADEIADSIHLGKRSEKLYSEPGKRGRKRGHFTEPLTPREEMFATIRVLRSYFIELQQMWEWASIQTPRILSSASKQYASESPEARSSLISPPLVIIDPETDQTLNPFANRASELASELSAFLAEAEKEEEHGINA